MNLKLYAPAVLATAFALTIAGCVIAAPDDSSVSTGKPTTKTATETSTPTNSATPTTSKSTTPFVDVPAPDDTKVPDNDQSYSNGRFGFLFNYAKTWQLGEEAADMSAVKLSGPHGASGEAKGENVSSAAEAENYCSKIFGQLEKRGFEPISLNKSQVVGRMSCEVTGESGDLRFIMVAYYGKGAVNSLRFEYPREAPGVDASVKSMLATFQPGALAENR